MDIPKGENAGTGRAGQWQDRAGAGTGQGQGQGQGRGQGGEVESLQKNQHLPIAVFSSSDSLYVTIIFRNILFSTAVVLIPSI